MFNNDGVSRAGRTEFSQLLEIAMAKAKGKATATVKTFPGKTALTTEERHRMIAEAAYFRAEARGFRDGDPLEDWLTAEAEFDRKRSGTRAA